MRQWCLAVMHGHVHAGCAGNAQHRPLLGSSSLPRRARSAACVRPARIAPRPQVTQQQRDHAKQLTYGLLYGMGAAKLADELGCGLEEAKEAQACMGQLCTGATGLALAWGLGIV